MQNVLEMAVLGANAGQETYLLTHSFTYLLMHLLMSVPSTPPPAGHSGDIVGFCWGFDSASNPEVRDRVGNLTSSIYKLIAVISGKV